MTLKDPLADWCRRNCVPRIDPMNQRFLTPKEDRLLHEALLASTEAASGIDGGPRYEATPPPAGYPSDGRAFARSARIVVLALLILAVLLVAGLAVTGILR